MAYLCTSQNVLCYICYINIDNYLHKWKLETIVYSTVIFSQCNTLNIYLTNWSNLVAVMDWGGANSRFLGLVSVWAARSFDQTALRPSVIKRIRQIDVKYITHITSFGVTA